MPKINNLQAAAANRGQRSGLESYLMGIKDPSIRRWLSKGCGYGSACNEDRLQQPSDKHLPRKPTPPTPARKRSSLARPVRVHDSFAEENIPVVLDWSDAQESPADLEPQPLTQQDRFRHSDNKVMKKQEKKDKSRKKKQNRDQNRLDQAIDDLVEIRVDEEVMNLPIRVRLGEFFELTLPKCRRRRRKHHHRMMIATMREKTMKSMMEAGGMRTQRQQGACKDTERLLKVLSINNVDQDNRYNVARCSLM